MPHLGVVGRLLTMCFVCVYVEKSNQSDSVLLGNLRYVTEFKLLFKINFVIFVLRL